ncbi:MAG TPA: RDD family protein [Polyangia bacterium]|nr:RDD family protein [Polyangia bacterium]
MFDGVIAWLALSPALVGVSLSTYSAAAAQTKSSLLLYRMAGKMGGVAAVLTGIFWIVNWVLLTRRGQTIGKIMVGTRVVRVDGTRAPFLNVVALRTWPLLVLSYIPGVNTTGAPLLAFIDALFIFRSDRRCLHDVIAGTKVIRLEPKSPRLGGSRLGG